MPKNLRVPLQGLSTKGECVLPQREAPARVVVDEAEARMSA